MFDARIFPKTLDTSRAILENQRAVLKGEYEITNRIYKHNKLPLEQIFLRLRIIPKNIWNNRPVIVSIKSTEIKTIGKQSTISFKKEFDTESEAEQFIQKSYSEEYTFDFSFKCIGWQYFLGEEGVDLEMIEGHPSIEFKSKTEEGLHKLLTLFGVQEDEVLKGPSVIAIKNYFYEMENPFNHQDLRSTRYYR